MPTLPTDVFFANQWHLLNAGQSGGTAGVDLRIFDGEVGVWDEFTGLGVSIGVIDDGVDYDHVDLDDNYDASLEGSVDGYHPNTGESHGTAVAGIIAAENNGVGVVGVAYDAALTSLPAITATGGLDLLEALQLGQTFDIVNNSWGYNNPFVDNPNHPAFASDFAAMEAMLTDGRGGLGTIFVKSAGNERSIGSNANSSGTNTFHGSVTVAAIDHDGFVASYSSEGPCILVSAFGGNFTDPGRIWTTDRSDGFGYDDVPADEDYTQGFNGTSAAAPMVSGVVALMLDANEGLGWRDVQAILSYTARHTGTDIGSGSAGFERYAWRWNGADDWNNGALHFSNDYGFGVVDALAAVRLAEFWSPTKTSANLAVTSADAAIGTSILIPDADPVGVSFTIDVTDDIAIENLRLTLQGGHSFVGDLRIELTSPDGTTSSLWLNNEGSTEFPAFGWVLSSNLFRGEGSAGTWTVTIRDVASFDTGFISGATLEIEGAGGADAADDTYVFTNEYSDYADPTRNALTDADGGVDELNAAAVTSASQINLVLGALNVIDGVVFEMEGAIEIAVGGDGADTITGNGAANTLIGGRGADTMIGAAGNDTFYVDDLLDAVQETGGGGSADKVITSVTYALGAGVQVEALQTTAVAGTGAINLTGNEFAQTIRGNNGANQINGRGGADDLYGFGGNDTIFVDDANDDVFETATGGAADVVAASTTYALDAGVFVEELKTTSVNGTAAIDLTGNEIAQTIRGNAGANRIDGGGGADDMHGARGNDTYVVDDFDDDVFETSGGGTNDAVETTVTYRLDAGVHVERLRTDSVSGTDLIDLTGNEFANIIQGNAAANRINGRGGADDMYGYGGNDTHFVDDADDDVFETGAGGTADIVAANTDYALDAGVHVEFLRTTSSGGTAAIDLTGNERINTINGNAGANQLNGGLGSDTLSGGAGADSFFFSTALGASNVDKITDFQAPGLVDVIRLENAVFVGLTAGAQLAAGQSDRIIYDSGSGDLFWDRDGAGATFSAIRFAVLDAGLTLQNSDFQIV